MLTRERLWQRVSGAPLWGIVANMLVLPLVGLLTSVCLLLPLLPSPAWWCSRGAPWVGSGEIWSPCSPGSSPWPPVGSLHGSPCSWGGSPWPTCTPRCDAPGPSPSLLASSSLTLVALRGTGRAPETLIPEAPDLGQGDGLILQVPGGDATLIDTGPNPWAARRLVRVLSRRGGREPVHLVLTHPHGDHAGGWATLARLWPLASVTGPAMARPATRWEPFAPPSPVPQVRAVQPGEAWERGEARLDVRWPPKPFELPDANMGSLVLRVRWRDHELWPMGDALGIQERVLLDLGDPEAFPGTRLLKPGHHGSASASDPAWLEALRPDLVLFSVGRSNPFGFPAPATLEALRQAGDPSTATSGPAQGVQVCAEPRGWRIQEGNGRMRRVSPGASGP